MRILTLCYEYPPIGGGGGNVAKSVAEQLVARGHEVRVQTAALGWRSRRETIGGVEVFRTASLRRAPDACSVPEMGLYCATSFFPALLHCRDWEPDVIHAHFAIPTGVLAWTVNRLTGRPYVITAHLGDVPGGAPGQTDGWFRLAGPLARQVWQSAAAATAVSSHVEQLAVRAYGVKVNRILNGADVSHATPPTTPQKTRHLVFVGRFNPQKCPVFLIDVLARLADLDWKLTMIGDGVLKDDIRRQVELHGLGQRVTLTGWVESPTVRRVLADADLLLMPSTFEGLPVAAIEALQHGVAIAASDIPGIRDVVQPGINGLRLPVADLEAWTSQLRALLLDDARLIAMKKASAESASAFDLQLIAKQYEAVLEAASRHPHVR